MVERLSCFGLSGDELLENKSPQHEQLAVSQRHDIGLAGDGLAAFFKR